MNLRFAPVAAFLALCTVFALLIWQKPDAGKGLPSPLVGKAFPTIELIQYQKKTTAVIDQQALQGRVTLVNIFASWCVPCLLEHPLWQDLLAQTEVNLVGIAWKDSNENITKWLEKHGNPYAKVFIDRQGSSTTILGITGVPETYIIDKKGIIRLKLAMPINQQIIKDDLLPLIKQLEQE